MISELSLLAAFVFVVGWSVWTVLLGCLAVHLAALAAVVALAAEPAAEPEREFRAERLEASRR